MNQKEFTAKPLIDLVVAGGFWGFGFVGTIWCLQTLSAPAVILYRFAISALLGMAILTITKISKKDLIAELKISFPAGFLLALTLVLQTYGLPGTGATKSAFITTTYVVIVPIMSHFFGVEKIRWMHWLWVLVAIIGAFYTLNVSLSGWTMAELLTCLNAVTASLHIMWIGRVARKSKNALAFNTAQSMWITIWMFPFIFISDGWDLSHVNTVGWLGMAALGFGSSFIAFLLQIRAQKELSPALASVLFLLESPFSFLFAFLLLGETLLPSQVLGVALILAACVGSIRSSLKASAA